MSKNFSKEDYIKKAETNIKSAVSGFSLAGVLGLAYIIRYFFAGNLDFYFSLSFPELMLRIAESNGISKALAVLLVAVFVAVYVVFCVLAAKNAKNLRFATAFYMLDSVCLVPLAIIQADTLKSEFFIDVIVHVFVLLFLFVGISSVNFLAKEK